MNDARTTRALRQRRAPRRPTRGRLGVTFALLVYTALAAHMLFIPYAYAPLSFEGAAMRFSDIEWMDLGSDQNVALVSRALTWLPIGLLAAAAVVPVPQRRIELQALVAGTSFGVFSAVVINFCQLWFPARTFSLNNLAAEICGGLIGAALWSVGGAGAMRWWKRLLSGESTGVKAALQCYVVLYLVAILTPFDFVTSTAELSEKLGREHLYAWWVASAGCGPTSCGIKWIAVVLACVPCGWWFATLRPNERHAWLPAALVALVVGAAVEALHFLMVSGVTQGVSVVARALGMALGALTWSARRRAAGLNLSVAARPVVLAGLPVYFVALFYLGGWARSERLPGPAGWQRLDEVSWMPFFQEYYSSYQATMISLLTQAVAYGLVGIALWLWSRDAGRLNRLNAALSAAALCFVVEGSKLWLVDRLPDFTNVFVAAGAAFTVAALLRAGPRPANRPGKGSRSTSLVA